MLPNPYLPAAIAEIARLDQARRDLATARGITPAEKRRRAGHLVRHLARLRRLPLVVPSSADTTAPQPAHIELRPIPRRSS
jgi:hypothetical protein